jgi:hypothetical protein
VSCPVTVRMLFVSVARLDSELLHDTPSMRVLRVLPLLGVGEGEETDANVTLNAPSVIDFVPVAPDPATATSENENVPEALVDVSEFTVIVPLPVPTAACQPAAGLPIKICAFAALSGPSAYVPVPAAVGVSAKPRVVLREGSVPPIDRMPFVKAAVIDVAVALAPSTLNVSVLPALGVFGAGLVGVAGDVGLLWPPPHATANAAERTAKRPFVKPAIGILPALTWVARQPPLGARWRLTHTLRKARL